MATAHPQARALGRFDRCRPKPLDHIGPMLSPAFPIGAVSYSHGLRWRCRIGTIHDAASLRLGWQRSSPRFAGRTDAILLNAGFAGYGVHEADPGWRRALGTIVGTTDEMTQQGAAFVYGWLMTSGAWTCPTLTLPIAFGAACHKTGLARRARRNLFLHAFVSALGSAAIRAVPLRANGRAAGDHRARPLCHKQ